MEVDAYCFSTLATEYATDGFNRVTESIVSGSPTQAYETQPVDALNNALQFFDERGVAPENQIIFASPKFLKHLRSTGELYKRLDQAEYKKNVSFLIEEYEGRPIVMVAPDRFKTGIDLKDSGYTFTNGKEINFMVVAKDAVYHVVKYNKVRVFAPEVVQDYDGYKVNARIYHDVFVPDNKRCAVYVSIAYGAASTGLPVGADVIVKNVAGAVQNGTVISELRVIPSTAFVAGVYYKLGSSSLTASAPGSTFVSTNYTALTIGSEIAASTNTHAEIVAVDAGSRVIGATVIELVKHA